MANARTNDKDRYVLAAQPGRVAGAAKTEQLALSAHRPKRPARLRSPQQKPLSQVNRHYAAEPRIPVRCRFSCPEPQRRRGAGQDSCMCPSGAEDRTSPRASVSLTEVRAAELPEPAECLQAPDPAAVRKRSQARRLGAGGEHSGSRRPGRRAAPCSKGIVTSAATARALRHALSSLAAPGGTTASPGRCASRTARSSRQSPRCCSHRT
jgi:hypothetical protein